MVGNASALFPCKQGKTEDMENLEFINTWSKEKTLTKLALALLVCVFSAPLSLTAATVTGDPELHPSWRTHEDTWLPRIISLANIDEDEINTIICSFDGDNGGCGKAPPVYYGEICQCSYRGRLRDNQRHPASRGLLQSLSLALGPKDAHQLGSQAAGQGECSYS